MAFVRTCNERRERRYYGQLTATVPYALYAAFHELARRRGTSVSKLAKAALQQWLATELQRDGDPPKEKP